MFDIQKTPDLLDRLLLDHKLELDGVVNGGLWTKSSCHKAHQPNNNLLQELQLEPRETGSSRTHPHTPTL